MQSVKCLSNSLKAKQIGQTIPVDYVPLLHMYKVGPPQYGAFARGDGCTSKNSSKVLQTWGVFGGEIESYIIPLYGDTHQLRDLPT